MSENIKVSEVSDILRKQLEGINANVQLDEIGTVLQVSDGVVRIYGLRNAEANELLEFDNGIKAIVMNLEEDNVGAVLLGPTDKIKEGFVVKRTKRIASIRVGEGMLGRVIDPLGEPLDGKGLVGGELYDMPLERKAPGVIYRQPVNQPLQTGLKADGMRAAVGKGGILEGQIVEKSIKNGIMKSGAVSGARNPHSKEARAHAERYYGLVRSMKTDVSRIAKATGFAEEDIRAIKYYIFMEKHDLGGKEPEYFAPDYMMAESWQRLIDGKPELHDMTLLNHEILERELMQEGMPQDEAHIIASQKYNYAKEAGEYYAKIKKYKNE